MNIYEFNPWWKTSIIAPNLLGIKRKLFSDAQPYLSNRQILMFTGLRRTGKTTLMYQFIDALLKQGVSTDCILYYSFDEETQKLSDILNTYSQEVLNAALNNNKLFIFLDEIQKLPKWENQLKLIYDQHPNIKFIVSGSAQINLYTRSRESLAGRFFEFKVYPLNFDEYLLFKKIDINHQQENRYENELKTHFHTYLTTGGFIETFEFSDKLRQQYFREGLLDRILFKDILEAFPTISLPSLLMQLVKMCAYSIGIYADYKNIGNDLKIDQRTIANYVYYLEYALIQQKLYNHSHNLIKSEKKLKRLYLSNTAFTYALNPQVDFSKLIEQYFVNYLKAQFFFRSPQRDEIDIIIVSDNQKLTPIEVKIKNTIKNTDMKTLKRYMANNNVDKGILISKNTEENYHIDNRIISIIPYWKFWTIKKSIQSMMA